MREVYWPPAADTRGFFSESILKMNESNVICLLGMHRSGTSLVAGLMNLLGVYLGPEQQFIDPSEENPKGFWELRRIVALNEEILHELGGSWHRPPQFIPGWEKSAELEEFRRRARTIIENSFSSAEIWGWKDPRTCLTLPFWQQLLPSMRYVTCLRHPMDVAQSLRRRNNFPLEKGVYLWLTYLQSIMQHTAGQTQKLVFYEDFINNCRDEVEKLSAFLGVPHQAQAAALRNAATSFIDGGLQHHRTSSVDEVAAAATGAAADALRRACVAHLRLQEERRLHQSDVGQIIQEALGLIAPEVQRHEALREHGPEEQWERQLHRATREIAGLVPLGDTFILVDGDNWGTDDDVAGRRRIPFLEREGQYWGAPPDDETAIRELERLRRSGARYLAVGWPAFWWLEHYSRFNRYVRSRFPCRMENDRVVLFDLRFNERAVDRR